jgi:hypothetical protein
MEPIQVFENNLETVQTDCCPICLNNFSDADNNFHVIEECSHKFHSECLIKWLRTRNDSSCPLCRNVSQHGEQSYSYFEAKNRFSLISSYSRRRNAHPYIKRIMEKYRTQFKLLMHNRKLLKDFRKRNKVVVQQHRKLITNVRNGSWKLTKLKKEIVKVPIVPLYITRT